MKGEILLEVISALAMTIIMFCIVMLIHTFVKEAEAQTPPPEITEVRLVTATGEQSIPCTLSEQIFIEIKAKFQNEVSPLKFRLKSKSCMVNPYVQTLANRNEIFWKWYDLLPIRRDILTIIIAPPIPDSGGFYTAELASNSKDFMIVNFRTPFQPEGIIHRNYALGFYATLHGIGHTFGAGHRSVSPNIMHPNALSYVDAGQELNYLGSSIREMVYGL